MIYMYAKEGYTFEDLDFVELGTKEEAEAYIERRLAQDLTRTLDMYTVIEGIKLIPESAIQITRVKL